MDALLSLIIYLLIAAVLLYVINLVIGMLTLPPQVKTIVLIVVGLIFLVWILRTLGIVAVAMRFDWVTWMLLALMVLFIVAGLWWTYGVGG